MMNYVGQMLGLPAANPWGHEGRGSLFSEYQH